MNTMTTDRETMLAVAVTEQIRRGWRVEAQVGDRVILAKGRGKRCHHGAHLLFSAFTVGLWLPFYALAAVKCWQFRTRRQAVCIDQCGNVQVVLL